MLFYTNKNYRFRPLISEFPAFSLNLDGWDDYNTKSTFHLIYHPTNNTNHEIGSIKIIKKDEQTTINKLQTGELDTILPQSFPILDEDCISLAQDIAFFSNLLDYCGREVAIDALESLREISWQPPLAAPFEPLAPFRNSLLRANSAHKARRFGQAVIRGDDIDERFSFTYSARIPGADAPTECTFDFDETDLVPGRIIGIIGRNAVGKTKFLAQLAEDLVQNRPISVLKAMERDEKFRGQKPIFNRIITISYSAFDKFVRPKSQQVSYVYCGIRDEKGGLSRRSLVSTYKSNLQRIRLYNRQYRWIEFMQEILGDQSQGLREHLDAEISSNELEDETLSLLSSGQAILANFITSLVAWIEPNSLVLFDEPETHLHPNAVANLFNVFNSALKEFNSFAVVATHSPLVIQEIPSKRVILFQRNENITTAEQLPLETFGSNISELTRHVFETIEIPTYYRTVLDRLSHRKTFDEVMALFDNNLSINAQSYLMTRYMGRPE